MGSEKLSKFISTAFVLLFISISPTYGGQIVQERQHELPPGAINVPLTFAPFDDDEGRRQLQSIDISYSGEMGFGVEVLNFDDTSYDSGEWFVDAYLNTLLAFGEREGYEDGGPFFGLGGISITQITGPLGPGDGGGPFGGTPGEPTVESFSSGSFIGSASLTSDFDYFLADQPLQAVIGPLSDIVLTPPPGAFFIDSRPTVATHKGVVTLAYTFDLVGDFDGNDQLDANDIGLLFENMDDASSKYDLDGNGAIEFSDVEFLVERLIGTYFGDSNLDGLFSSADMVQVFQAGEYDDAIAQNSTWEEGDWNGDGDFDSADLVLAFADGGFENGPRATLVSVPEPDVASSLSLVLLGIAFFTLRIRSAE